MLVSFVKGYPALLIIREKALVVGDLHIGLDLKFKESGIHFQNATGRLANKLMHIYKESGAKSLVLLGDIKDSITSPSFGEYRELKRFFETISGIKTTVVKGNHDGGIESIFRNIGIEIDVEKELRIGGIAMTHGNSWPSEDAMRARYLVVSHGHFALMKGYKTEKVWFVSKIANGVKKRYERYNKKENLIVMPPFNELITGSALSTETKGHLLVLKNDIFSFDKGKVYDLRSNYLGTIAKIVG
jgi:hypothetical protein